MSLPIQFRGDTIELTLLLRYKNKSVPAVPNDFILPSGYQIDVFLPNDPTLQPSGAITASTLNAGEIEILNAQLTNIKATFFPLKSAKCLITPTAVVDVKVTDTTVIPNKVTTFESVKIIQIKDRTNL